MNQDLLHKYFKGETSVDEEKRILNWVDETGYFIIVLSSA